MSRIKTFQIVEGGVVILSIGGRYGQYPLYRRGFDLFAEVKGSYIRLLGRQRTSVPNTLWHDAEVPLEAGWLGTNKLGNPVWCASPAEAERLVA